MVIGRDTIPIHMINTYTQFPASSGGASPAITLATKSNGGNNNAVKFALFDGNANNYNYSGGVLEGGTLGTATSPTRTTQTISIAASTITSAASASGKAAVEIIVGGYIRHNGSSISSPQWTLDSSAIISQSISNSGVVGVLGQLGNNNIASNVDATTFDTGGGTDLGIYDISSSGSGPHMLALAFGSGRGNIFPASGDTFTIRMGATATVDGTSVSAVHDIIINIS